MLPDNFGAFTAEQYDFSAATPLLVIDGQNGPLDLGRIPMYRLPSVILRLLGEERQTMFDLVQVPRSVIPRPLPDVMVTYQGRLAAAIVQAEDGFRGSARTRRRGWRMPCCSTRTCSPAASTR